MSAIEWTEQTWNPTTGCDRVSTGCDNCYALTMAKRLKATGNPKYQTDGDPRTSGPGFGITEHPTVLIKPYQRSSPTMWFVNSMSDLFHPKVSDGFIARVWHVMGECPWHTYQILTKRPARMKSWLNRWVDTAADAGVCDPDRPFGLPPMPREPEAVRNTYTSGRAQLFADMLENMGEPPEGCAYPLYDWMEGQRFWPKVLPHVWLGTSVENQEQADRRIPYLQETPAAVRFLSCEPLLGPIDIWKYLWLTGASIAGPFYDSSGRYRGGGGIGGQMVTSIPSNDLHWVIVGGESGKDARPCKIEWIRSIIDQCDEANVPVFVKQLGSVWAATNSKDRKGGDPDFWPEALQRREYPAGVHV